MKKLLLLALFVLLLPTRSHAQAMAQLNQFVYQMYLGQDTTIGYVDFLPIGPNCHSTDCRVSFDNGDISFFRSTGGCVGNTIHCSAQKLGPLDVYGDLYFSTDNCGTVSKLFRINILVNDASSSVPRAAPSTFRQTYDPITGAFIFEQISIISSTLQFDLYDLTGRLVRSIQRDVPSGASEIDLGASSLPAGCYWYVVRGDGWSKSGKVMKLPGE